MNKVKYFFWLFVLVVLSLLLFFNNGSGATVLYPFQGGTGLGSAVVGDVGKYLKLSDESPMTYVLDTIDGENIQDDTIDDDSIDFSDVTLADLTFDVGNVDTTEFGYLNGVTSAIQTQIDGKVTAVASTDNAITRFDGANGALQNSGLILDDSNNITGPTAGFKITGGTATTADLTFQTTSGVGATGADMHFLVGNNGGTEAMTILNNGNVGIGMASPTDKLVVSGSLSIVDNSFIKSTRTTDGVFSVFNKDGILTIIGQVSGVPYIGTSTNNAFGMFTNNLERIRITNAGNVGIGTTTPTAVLHLKAGTATASTAPLKFTSGTLLTTPEAGAVEFLTDAYYGTITTGAARKTFAFLESPTFTGTVTIPTPFTLGATSVTATGTQLNYLNAATGTTGTTSSNLVFSTSPTLTTPTIASLIGNKIYPASDSTTAIQFNKADGTTNVVNIDTTNSRVGIGTAAPSASLEVNGTILVPAATTGYLYFGSSANFIASDNSTWFEMRATGANVDSSLGSNRNTSLYSDRDQSGSGDIIFKPKYIEAMRITNAGLIGIGTTSPTGNLAVSQTATATGALKGIVYTGAVNTNQTLSTEIPAVTITTAGREWATGALTTQREVLITQPTYSFVGASTITDAATVGIAGAPIKSTNATITNTHGLLIQAGAVSTATNSYGLTVNAQTGATNNYSAAFLGGNVGIGTTSPTAVLHLKAGTATASTAPLKFTSGTSLTTAEAGAMEFTTDDFYATITTGAARKGIVLNDGANLTATKVPVASTNGRLIDSSFYSDGNDNWWVGDGTGIPFGGMYMYQGAEAVTVASADTWYELTAGISAGSNLNLFTFDGNHYLVPTKAGRYKISWSASATSGTGDQVMGGITINSADNNTALASASQTLKESAGHGTVSVVNKFVELSGSVIVDLAANDQISLVFANEDSATNVTVEHVTVTVSMMGGT